MIVLLSFLFIIVYSLFVNYFVLYFFKTTLEQVVVSFISIFLIYNIFKFLLLLFIKSRFNPNFKKNEEKNDLKSKEEDEFYKKYIKLQILFYILLIYINYIIRT